MITLKFWRAIEKFASIRAFNQESKMIEKFKRKYNGKNPVMTCNCDDCWSYAIVSGVLEK